MKISIVTVSFNQGKFLAQAIRSVLEQEYDDIEYIVVDPGSRDCSRDIINSYRPRLNKIVFEPDQGPADGLNKGFSYSTGDIYGFLNADDYLLPGALKEIAQAFAKQSVEIVSGHVVIVDEHGKTLRKSYSDHFSLKACAYGQSHLMQPSTFFCKSAFETSGGFNKTNCSNWDGELFIELALQGCRFTVLNRILSAYRLHGSSITGSGRLDLLIKEYQMRMFERIMCRKENRADSFVRKYYWLRKALRNPRNIGERAMHGRIYKSYG